MLATGRRYYTEQQNLSALAVRQVRRQDSLTEALQLLAVYQATAALLALEHGNEALREQDISSAGATVLPAAFTVTPAAPSVLDDVDRGFAFDRIVGSLVADAGRSAMGVFTASRREEIGNVRQLVPPSCQRCAVLAGRWYRWSDGFQRHPLCDCVMVPGTRSAATYDPHKAFERGEITDLSKAQTKAIEDGADIGQVVNAQRGLQTVSFAGRRVRVTTEGTTSRGLAFTSLVQRGGSVSVQTGRTALRNTASGPELRQIRQTIARAPRLSPEAIYNIAGADRALAQNLLRLNGYIA